MAKLVTKFKYLKPHARQNVGGYAKYIATWTRAERFGSHGLLQLHHWIQYEWEIHFVTTTILLEFGRKSIVYS